MLEKIGCSYNLMLINCNDNLIENLLEGRNLNIIHSFIPLNSWKYKKHFKLVSNDYLGVYRFSNLYLTIIMEQPFKRVATNGLKM